MIRPLRIRHRAMMAVLAVVIPLVFVAGLMAREPIPVMEQLPEAVVSLAQPSLAHQILEADDLWTVAPITTRVFGDATPATHLAVELTPQASLKLPDVLVYWAPQQPAGMLPGDSFLVSSLDGTETVRGALPEAALRTDGFLILFSLARQEVIDVAPLTTRQPTPTIEAE